MLTPDRLEELAPQAVRHELAAGRILLVDVREPAEFAAERIHGALNVPLSTFDPKALPQGGGRRLVLHCGVGKRSETALRLCLKAGLRDAAHMAGGLAAWRRADLPVAVRDAR